MRGRLDYRPDLDGLRAVAVVPVILFHLGAPYMPGGFVGVDVFFVLSGFFITRQIALELAENRFSVLNFYDRRIRRLFPALFVMLFASAIVAWLVLLPDDLRDFGKSLASTALSISNIYFLQKSDYFAPAAETMPLLHTWSLGVEEQFYLLFPVFLMLLWRHLRANLFRVVCFIAAVSFAGSVWGAEARPQATFYLLPTRAWELLLGSILALSSAQAPKSWRLRNTAAIAGLAGIGIAIVTYNKEMPFPGLAAALPCLGCALLIWAGQSTVQAVPDSGHDITLVSRILALPPFVFIGLISYSLYLWHWPIIVFAHQTSPRPLTFDQAVVVALTTVCIAYASWRLIEQPLRRGDVFWPTRGHRLRYGGLAIAGIGALGAIFCIGKGFPERNAPEVLAAMQDAKDISPHRARCHIDAKKQGNLKLADTCVFGSKPRRRVVLLGDSHGAELSYALAEVADVYGLQVRQITASGCPPAFNIAPPDRKDCPRHVERMIEGLSKVPKSTVFVAAYYFSWADPKSAAREAFWLGLERVVARLRDGA